MELLFYWLVWIGSVFYSLWSFIYACEQHYHELDGNDFKDGWILARHQDNSDIEWNILTSLFRKYWFLLAFQLLCSRLISRNHKHVLPLFYTIYSLLCLSIILGPNAVAVFVIYVALMIVLHWTGLRSVCYISTVVALLILHNPYIIDIKVQYFQTELQSFSFEVAYGWLLIKCLSFTIDRIESDSYKRLSYRSFLIIFSYCFYLPTVFTGPIMCYHSFRDQVVRYYQLCFWKTFFRRASYLLYLLLLCFLFEVLLHVVYSSAVQYHPELCSTFSSWALCGLGYALPMMFFLKYFIIYGVTAKIAHLEYIKCPPPPRCITAIHSSSFLYRHFDRGLYLWILHYLYYPFTDEIINTKRKLCGLFTSFAFVCLWHGMEKPVCMWTFLNFILVSSEILLKPFLSFGSENYFKKKGFSARDQRRLSALCSTGHFMMMCISCTFFLSNWDIGMLLLKRVMFTGLIPFLPIAFIMYCGCHVAMQVASRKVSKPICPIHH